MYFFSLLNTVSPKHSHFSSFSEHPSHHSFLCLLVKYSKQVFLLHLLPLTLKVLRFVFLLPLLRDALLMHCFLYNLIMNMVLSICDFQKWLSWSQLYILIFPNKGTPMTIDLRFPGEWICLYSRFFLISMSFPYAQ